MIFKQVQKLFVKLGHDSTLIIDGGSRTSRTSTGCYQPSIARSDKAPYNIDDHDEHIYAGSWLSRRLANDSQASASFAPGPVGTISMGYWRCPACVSDAGTGGAFDYCLEVVVLLPAGKLDAAGLRSDAVAKD